MSDITREEAIQILKDDVMIQSGWANQLSGFSRDIADGRIEAHKMGIECLENQKIGHWIKDGDSYSDLYDYKIRCHCSICGNEKFFIDRKTTSGTPCIKNCDNVDKYCSNCGAKMEGK